MKKLGMGHWVVMFFVLFVSASFLAMADNETKSEGKEEGEKIVNITEVPSGVRAVIEKNAEGGEIKEIEMNNKEGKIFYSADIVKGGKTLELSVAADGTLMKEENEEEGKDEQGGEQKIDYKDVPQAVKNVAEKNLGATGPFTASVEMEEGAKVYEVQTEKDGMASSVNVAEDGTLLEIEKQIPASEAPKSILSGLEEKFPKAKVQKITLVQKFSYEVEVLVNKEIKISPTGEIKKDKGEEGKKEEGKKEWGKKEEGKKEWGGKMKEEGEKKVQKEENKEESD